MASKNWGRPGQHGELSAWQASNSVIKTGLRHFEIPKLLASLGSHEENHVISSGVQGQVTSHTTSSRVRMKNMAPEITIVADLLESLRSAPLTGLVRVGATSKNKATRNIKALFDLRRRADGDLTAEKFHQWIVDFVNDDRMNASYAGVLSWDLRTFSDALDEVSAKTEKSHYDPSQLVTLDQLAAMVRKKKRTLERWQKDDSCFPRPNIEGGGGKANYWNWPDVVEYLRKKSHISVLPDRYPSLNQSR